jgi:hypothetical protein
LYFINQSQLFPRSTAWLIIQSYYAAFFAANSIVRMLGISCSQLEKPQTEKIDQIAQLFKMDGGLKISTGYYQCVYNDQNKQLLCQNFKSSKGGTHESFWNIFLQKLKDLSNNILLSGNLTIQSQAVATKIDELCRILCHEGKNGGNWLSYVRNTVNYRHELGSWFPYENISKKTIEELYYNYTMWLEDPMNISCVRVPGTDICLFHRACSFIVSLCRSLVQDMFDRCPKGQSYLSYGPIRLLNQASQGTTIPHLKKLK